MEPQSTEMGKITDGGGLGGRSRVLSEMSFRRPSEHTDCGLIWGLGRGPDWSYKFGNIGQNAFEYMDVKLTKILPWNSFLLFPHLEES